MQKKRKGGPATYNAESEIATANGVTYTYDGNRMRVAKSSAPLYWRDINGNTIAQTALNGTNQTEFVFFGGRRVARVNANGLVYYYQADQIGSTRSMTNSSGVRCYDADFPPYGTENGYTVTCAPLYKFAGYERDTETGLDYAVNRYYNSRIGRFMTPDPSGLGSASLSNPQSLNQYAYVLNNPLIGIDPLGLLPDDACLPEVDGVTDCTGALSFPGSVPIDPGIPLLQIPGMGMDLPQSGGTEVMGSDSGPDTNPALELDPGNFALPSSFSNSANSGGNSWGLAFTKAFFSGFSLFGSANDSRPSCFAHFLADAGTGFAESFTPTPSVGQILGSTTAILDYPNEVGIVAERHLARYGSRISKYTLGAKAGQRAGAAGLLANVDYQLGVALYNEWGSASSGECK